MSGVRGLFVVAPGLLAFTPPPDCDLPLADARCAWPEKTQMVNFPSSLHLQGPEAIRAHARRLLEEGDGDGHRFMVGVMEDVPNRGLDTIVPLAEEVATWRL